MDSRRQKYVLQGLGCVHCAQKIEQDLSELDGVNQVTLSFANSTMVIHGEREIELPVIRQIVKKYEPDVEVHILDASRPAGESSEKNRIKVKTALIIVALCFYIPALVYRNSLEAELLQVLFFSAYFLVGARVIYQALVDIKNGSIFGESVLMTIATAGALIIGEYPEAVAVMLFYQVGTTLQEHAVHRSRRSIKDLLALKADYANLYTGIGIKQVEPDLVEPGDIIIIKPGEKIPLDGHIIEGSSMLDASPLTGETIPHLYEKDAEVLAGMINLSNALKVKVSRPYIESTVARILDMVEEAETRKAPTEHFITKFSKYYTPAVIAGAFFLALIPPLFFAGSQEEWIYRALVFLVISCPCALVVSIPLGFFAGIGALSRLGILVKGANYIEALTRVKTVVLDKTGTLTEGALGIREIIPAGNYTTDDILYYAALAESKSNHPIAQAIMRETGAPIDLSVIKHYQEEPGLGVIITTDDFDIIAGNDRFLQRFPISGDPGGNTSTGTTIYLARNNEYIGKITFSDRIKPAAAETVKNLRSLGIRDIIMLSGDKEEIVQEVAGRIGIEKYYSGLLPQEKVAQVEELMRDQRAGEKVLYTGDGLNDAPVLMRADIGMVMGGIGAGASIEAADVVLMKDEITGIPDAISSSRRTRSIVIQNIIFALGIKAVFLLLGAVGIATMWAAVFADVGVTVLAVLNSLRALQFTRYGPVT